MGRNCVSGLKECCVDASLLLMGTARYSREMRPNSGKNRQVFNENYHAITSRSVLSRVHIQNPDRQNHEDRHHLKSSFNDHISGKIS
jgi:hypothetical protein